MKYIRAQNQTPQPWNKKSPINIHSPRWSFTVNASVLASRIRSPSQKPEEIFTPKRNLRLRIQLELSVNDKSPSDPTPSFKTTVKSPVSRGLFPSRSLTSTFSNSSWDQFSSSSAAKSPSSTTTSSLAAASGPPVTTRPVSASTKTTWMEDACSPSILLPVKRGSANLFLNCKRRFRWSGPCILFGEDLHGKVPLGDQYTVNIGYRYFAKCAALQGMKLEKQIHQWHFPV